MGQRKSRPSSLSYAAPKSRPGALTPLKLFSFSSFLLQRLSCLLDVSEEALEPILVDFTASWKVLGGSLGRLGAS